jgi:hypothetical protein
VRHGDKEVPDGLGGKAGRKHRPAGVALHEKRPRDERKAGRYQDKRKRKPQKVWAAKRPVAKISGPADETRDCKADKVYRKLNLQLAGR